MTDIFLNSFGRIRLYHCGKCYSLRGAYMDNITQDVNGDSVMPLYTIKGVLDKIESGMVPVKTAKHSYVVMPASYNNGTLELNGKSIHCDVKNINIESKSELSDATFVGADGKEKTVKSDRTQFATLSVYFADGYNFIDYSVKEDSKWVKEQTINRYTLMDLDD